MSTRITITKRYNKNELTIMKGCFNCVHYKLRKCVLTHHGKPIDVLKILTNDDRIEYRCGCCCADYKPYKERVEFT